MKQDNGNRSLHLALSVVFCALLAYWARSYGFSYLTYLAWLIAASILITVVSRCGALLFEASLAFIVWHFLGGPGYPNQAVSVLPIAAMVLSIGVFESADTETMPESHIRAWRRIVLLLIPVLWHPQINAPPADFDLHHRNQLFDSWSSCQVLNHYFENDRILTAHSPELLSIYIGHFGRL